MTTKKSSTVSAPRSSLGSICVIELPTKIWQSKVLNKYLPLDYSDDVDDEVFDFSQHRKPFLDQERIGLIMYVMASLFFIVLMMLQN